MDTDQTAPQEQSDLDLHCFSKRRLNISANDKSRRLLL